MQMNTVAKLVQFMKALDRKLWPDHRVHLSSDMAAILARHNLVVGDVGSAGGPEEIWASLKEYVHFLTFEPNPRPDEPVENERTTNFAIGLWSRNGEMELNITSHPDSSSLMLVNTA